MIVIVDDGSQHLSAAGQYDRQPYCARWRDNITFVSTPDQIENLLASIQPATDSVFDALDSAAPLLDAAFSATGPLRSIERYSSTRTHVARALVHRELDRLEDGAMGEWMLVRDTGPNCPVWLANGAHSIRLLHTWSPEVVPPTGKNRARVSYYSNSLLELEPEVLISSHKFLLLWERQGQEFTLRLVHTLGAVRLNKNVRLDLDISLERGVTFNDLAFEQREEDLDYFTEDVEEEGDLGNG